jgi:hypothetical protein
LAELSSVKQEEIMTDKIDYLMIPSGAKPPERFYQRYCELIQSTNYQSKKQNFHNILKALLIIFKEKKPVYDYATIVRIIKGFGGSGPSYTTIINKTGSEYQELIGLFIQEVGVSTKETKSESDDDRLLSYVTDRQARIRLREKLVIVRSLTNQLNIAKQQIANNSPAIMLSAHKDSTRLLPSLEIPSLTIGEIDAIKDFLSKYEQLGFFENDLGALMEPGGIHEFAPVGFLSALRKILRD